jgi:hypothetical protein
MNGHKNARNVFQSKFQGGSESESSIGIDSHSLRPEGFSRTHRAEALVRSEGFEPPTF